MTSDFSSFAGHWLERLVSQGTRRLSDFNALALELFAFQFARNLAYRRICEYRGRTPGNVRHWTEIPPVPATAFKEQELTCLLPGERTTVFHSSGTTGHRPGRHFHCAESLAVYEASLWAWFQENVGDGGRQRGVGRKEEGGRRKGEGGMGKESGAGGQGVLGGSGIRAGGHSLSLPATLYSTPEARHPKPDTRCLVSLTPSFRQAPHSSLVHMFETVRRRLGAPESSFVGTLSAEGDWTLDCEALLSALNDATKDRRPVLLLGTAFSFVQALDFLAERELRFILPPGSRVMETGGYKGRSRTLPKAELHDYVTRQLGIPSSHIISEYGMSELSSQAYDNLRFPISDLRAGLAGSSRVAGRPGCFHFPAWARARVISPETGCEVGEGDTGLLCVHDLANVASVMAIQTEDLAIRHEEGFELIGRAALAEPRGCSLMSNVT